MKRLLTLLLMLVSLSSATWADLTVGNVTVTATGNVNPTGLKAGAISYDASTNTLTLISVTYETSETYAIRCTGDTKLTIVFAGQNYIHATLGAISCSGPDLEIYGSGANSGAYIVSDDPHNGYFTPLTVYAKELYIHDLTLVTEGHHWGINGGTAGSTPRQSTLKISNANVKSTISSTTSGDGAIAGFKACTLTDCAAVDGTYYDSSKCGFKAAEGDDFAKAVEIQKVETYPIKVCDMAVNSYNAADILGDGTFKYDNSTKTLTIKDATIDNTDITDVVLNENVDDLKINIVGTNNLKVNNQLFELKAKTTFTGTGTVNGEVTDWQSVGIFLNKNANYQVIADGPTFNIKGARGVTGFAAPTFVMNSGKFVFEPSGTNENVFSAFGNPTLTLGEGMTIVEPVGGSYSASLHAITVDGTERYKGKVVIQKVESYGLEVSGIPVTSLNCADILGDGKVIYDNSTKTLTLNGATIINAESSESSVIQNAGVNPLTISVQGEASVVAEQDGKAAIISSHPVTIQGSGKLTLKSKSDCGLYVPHTSATIKDIELEASGAWGIAGYGGSEETLTIENAIVRAEGPNGAICDFKTITLGEGLSILTPADGKVSGGAVVDASGAVAKEVVIGVDTSTKYDLFVNGAQVTSVNAADILGDGKVVYDAEANELTLDGATLTGIENRVADLKVIVKGETTVENNADNAVLIDSYSNITFEGDGTLTLRSTNKTSLGMRLAATFSGASSVLTMLIQGPKVNITAGQGLYGTGFDPILDIYYPSTLSYAPVEGGNANPISGFLGFNLSMLTMVSPAGAYYNTSNRYVQLNDARYTGALLIDIEAYDLWIAGTRVTEVNKDDILGNGVFSYVSWYKTLKISGDYDHTTETRLVDSKIEDLIINVERPSRLTTTFDPTIIHLSANTEIRGGKLILECTSEDQDCIGIYQDGGDKLTISNADIEVGDGFSYAITGEPGIALEIISSDIVAKAHAEGCFKDFESMTLTDCYIESHRGATYTDGALVDTDGHIIGSDAQPETVVIKRGSDAVNGIAAGTAATDVFDVAGRKLDAVGRGINIVRSAEGRVRKVLKK